MSKIITSVVVVLIILTGGLGLTAEFKPDEFGFEYSQIIYKEPGVMKEQGNMTGLSLSFASYDTAMLKVEVRYSFGTVTYDGSYADGTPVSQDNIKDYGYEIRFLRGGRISASDKSVSYLYAGLGYRYLNDDSSAFPGGYEREANYYYIPIGLEFIPAVNSAETAPANSAPMLTSGAKNDWSIGAVLEYDIFLNGKQISYLSDVDPGLNDMTNTQNQGYGYRGSIRFRNSSTTIEPFIRYWNIEKSEEEAIYYYGEYIGYGYEPENNSTEIGIRIGIKF